MGTQRATGPSGFAAQHGPVSDHLPAVNENVELISKLKLKTPDAFKFDPDTGAPDPTEPDLVPGQIADVSIYKNAAYLASWAEPSCKRGGFFSVDISDPAKPEAAGVRPGAARHLPRRGHAHDHARHPGRLQGRRAGRQQRAVRAPTASAASTSTT